MPEGKTKAKSVAISIWDERAYRYFLCFEEGIGEIELF